MEETSQSNTEKFSYFSDLCRLEAYPDSLFQPSFLGGSVNTDIMSKYVRPIITNGNFYLYRFKRDSEAFKLYTAREPYFEIYIREKISRLWIEFLDASQKYRKNIQEKPSSDRLKTMVIFLNAHFDEEFSLKELADAAQCSVRECNRVFQIQMHTTPLAYLRLIRLQQACSQLLNTTKSITEIGECCGFNSSSYFGKIFHQKYGISPSEYRKKYC
jgi:AraC-like DNA-binding protein